MLVFICLLHFGVLDTIANECDGCCRNYTYNEDNNSCDPCPPGTYGYNCSSTCPENYYGLFCYKKCDCSVRMTCFPATGCKYPTTMPTVGMNTNEVDMNKYTCWKPEESNCCVNYYFNRENKSCDPCPLGTYGDNCSASCPTGYYGHLCQKICDCGTGMHCSTRTGCVNSTTISTTVELSTNEIYINKSCFNPEESRCCVNFYFNKENKRCDPCPPGTVGLNCTGTCPQGYHGLLCQQECNCSIGILCLPATGCVALITKTHHSGTNMITLVHEIVVVVAISVFCLAMGVLCCYRLRTFYMKYSTKVSHSKVPDNQRSDTNGVRAGITNANYALAQQPCQTIWGTIINGNDQVTDAVGIHNKTSPKVSDAVHFKRQSVEYNVLQLRIRNISCNSLDFDDMQKDYENCHLNHCFDNKKSEANCDHNSCSRTEIAVSDYCGSASGHAIITCKVQVHAESP